VGTRIATAIDESGYNPLTPLFVGVTEWWHTTSTACSVNPRVAKAKEIQKQLDEFRDWEEEAIQKGLSKDVIKKLHEAQEILKEELRKLFE
jgi:hypothetical protein